jgi:hypothetical protein
MAAEDRTPRNIVDDEDEDVISMGEDEEFENPLADLLVTSDGENIADAVVNAIDRVSKLLDTQNKIFIKMYTVLSKLADNKA